MAAHTLCMGRWWDYMYW